MTTAFVTPQDYCDPSIESRSPPIGLDSALQRVFFRMKRNFEKKQKSIARARKKGREEELLYDSSHVTFASHTFDNEVKDFT